MRLRAVRRLRRMPGLRAVSKPEMCDCPAYASESPENAALAQQHWTHAEVWDLCEPARCWCGYNELTEALPCGCG